MTKIGAGGNLIRIPIKCLEDFTVLGFRVNALSNHLRATVHVVTVKCMSKSMKKESFISRKTNWKLQKRYYRYFYPDSSILHKRLIFHMILYRHVCVNYRI
jgi:hypothetical protein